ncbi:MAG: Rrf2 family transcriptional regulator [Candidatus Paceibacterota bacterium]
MKISKKTRYGLRAVIYLAKEKTKSVCSLKEISEDQKISFDYLEKIMAELRKSNIVKSHQGPNGGYSLNKKPGEIKVGEIVEALEGGSLVDCISELGSCPQSEDCLAKEVWQKLQQTINKALDTVTLKDLIS